MASYLASISPIASKHRETKHRLNRPKSLKEGEGTPRVMLNSRIYLMVSQRAESAELASLPALSGLTSFGPACSPLARFTRLLCLAEATLLP